MHMGEWLGRTVHDGSRGRGGGSWIGRQGELRGPWALGQEGFGLKKLNLHLLGTVSLYSLFHNQNSRKSGLHLLFPSLPSSLSLYHVLSISTGSPASSCSFSKAQLKFPRLKEAKAAAGSVLSELVDQRGRS